MGKSDIENEEDQGIQPGLNWQDKDSEFFVLQDLNVALEIKKDGSRVLRFNNGSHMRIKVAEAVALLNLFYQKQILIELRMARYFREGEMFPLNLIPCKDQLNKD